MRTMAPATTLKSRQFRLFRVELLGMGLGGQAEAPQEGAWGVVSEAELCSKVPLVTA